MPARQRRKEPDLILETVTDYGPSVSYDRDGHLISSGPGAVVLEDREDISVTINSKAQRPVVRGARRWDALRGLLKDEVIDAAMFSAANRFLSDLSRAQGGSQASFLAIVVSGGAGMLGVTESQRRALQRVMAVRQRLRLTPQTVFWWVVLENRTPREWAEHRKIRVSRSYDYLRDSLTDLDDYYGTTDSRGSAVSETTG